MSREDHFTMVLEPDPDEGGSAVTVPALPGCLTQGETIDEAIVPTKEAIALQIEGLLAQGEPCRKRPSTPKPS